MKSSLKTIRILLILLVFSLFFVSAYGKYEVVNAFPDLKFKQPVALVQLPSDNNALYVLERKGRIQRIGNTTKPKKELYLDISHLVDAERSELGLLGLAFHPEFEKNKHLYLFYTRETFLSEYNRLSRFTQFDDNRLVNPVSELVLFDQEDDAWNHNGGDLHFGPDGYLYVALGDEGKGGDKLDNSQLIDKDFFAGIIRIDVDKREGNLEPNPHEAIVLDSRGKANYSVPADNPWVGINRFNKSTVDPEKVRTEFWAVGLRNPWRFSFDSKTGVLFCGDVGQGKLEEIDIIEKGGNYGWAWKEASINGRKHKERVDGVELIDPIFEYSRDQGVSVTGGLVYYGKNCPDLYGKYIFADYAMGNIWSLEKKGNKWHAEVIANSKGISAFGTDPLNGDLLMANHNSGKIERLILK